MTPAELKAIMKVTTEVAVYPMHIEGKLPHSLLTTRRRFSCPLGCKRAHIIKDGQGWIQKFTLGGCGDTEYETERRNGLLVEFDLEDLGDLNDAWATMTIKGNKAYLNGSKIRFPHTTQVITRDGKKYIRMIVSRKAVAGSWSEYALIQAQREKESAEHQAKEDRLRLAQAALMGHEGNPEFYDIPKVRNTCGYLNTGYEKIHYWYGGREGVKRLGENEHFEVGKIQITIDQAEKIWNMLTPKQRKALKNG